LEQCRFEQCIGLALRGDETLPRRESAGSRKGSSGNLLPPAFVRLDSNGGSDGEAEWDRIPRVERMTSHEFFFWSSAIVSVGAAAMVLLTPAIVHMAFWLLASLAGFAGLYLHLGADFVGFTQIIVYIGGILILFLFGVMLTNRSDVPVRGESSWRFLVPGSIAGVAVVLFLVFIVARTPWNVHAPSPNDPTSEAIGADFMSRYVLPFEAVSVLLLVAMVGATYVARIRDEDAVPPESGPTRKEGEA
jgi:NADH:ubiquinone oxidoreductase subunit 6 (subunit J)